MKFWEFRKIVQKGKGKNVIESFSEPTNMSRKQILVSIISVVIIASGWYFLGLNWLILPAFSITFIERILNFF